MDCDKFEEYIIKKLQGWSKYTLPNVAYWRIRRDIWHIDLIVNKTNPMSTNLVVLYTRVGQTLDKKGWVMVERLQDVFKDPFNITPEEASLFKLEYGVDYPKELVNDL